VTVGFGIGWWLLGGALIVADAFAGTASVVRIAGDWVRPLVFQLLAWWMCVRALWLLMRMPPEGRSEGLGNRRYLPGLAALLPGVVYGGFGVQIVGAGVLIASGVVCWLGWCRIVAPLWQAHDAAARQRCVNLVGIVLGILMLASIALKAVANVRC